MTKETKDIVDKCNIVIVDDETGKRFKLIALHRCNNDKFLCFYEQDKNIEIKVMCNIEVRAMYENKHNSFNLPKKCII